MHFERGNCKAGTYCNFVHETNTNSNNVETGAPQGKGVTNPQNTKKEEANANIHTGMKVNEKIEQRKDMEKKENFQEDRHIVVNKLIQRVEDIWKELKELQNSGW